MPTPSTDPLQTLQDCVQPPVVVYFLYFRRIKTDIIGSTPPPWNVGLGLVVFSPSIYTIFSTGHDKTWQYSSSLVPMRGKIVASPHTGGISAVFFLHRNSTPVVGKKVWSPPGKTGARG